LRLRMAGPPAMLASKQREHAPALHTGRGTAPRSNSLSRASCPTNSPTITPSNSKSACAGSRLMRARWRKLKIPRATRTFAPTPCSIESTCSSSNASPPKAPHLHHRLAGRRAQLKSRFLSWRTKLPLKFDGEGHVRGGRLAVNLRGFENPHADSFLGRMLQRARTGKHFRLRDVSFFVDRGVQLHDIVDVQFLSPRGKRRLNRRDDSRGDRSVQICFVFFFGRFRFGRRCIMIRRIGRSPGRG
jgi:hypothetical protein